MNELVNSEGAMQTQLELSVETKNEEMQRMALLNLGMGRIFVQSNKDFCIQRKYFSKYPRYQIW